MYMYMNTGNTCIMSKVYFIQYVHIQELCV